MRCSCLRISKPAKCLGLDDARHFALRSLDRILAEAWQHDHGMLHVIAYSDPAAQKREVAGVLDDYAFSGLACLDAYEATGALSYFNFARKIGDAMIEKFFDKTAGGFFDTAAVAEGVNTLGCAIGAAQTISGFTNAGGKFDGRDSSVASLSVHE